MSKLFPLFLTAVMEGVAAMKNHCEGKITLLTYKPEAAPLPTVNSKLIERRAGG